MSWAEPAWGALLVVVAALAVVLAVTRALHARKLRRLFGEGELLARAMPARVRWRRHARDVLALLGLVGVVAALAEPRFDKRLRELKAEGVDLVLAVDLSRSMDATDVDPSRLERARREILDLIGLLEGDRVGLVMFAAGAYPRMPLTLDTKALAMIVRELDTHTFQAQGSSFGLALRESTKLLQAQSGEAGKAVLLLTDGEAHDADDAVAAAKEAAAAGITVYGLVIGTEASPIPDGDGTFVTDPSTGERVTSAPSTEVLDEIARLTGGAVVRSVPGAEDVRALYGDEIRRHLKAAVGRTAKRETWDSAFQWPLGLGLLALLVAGWLGDGRRATTLIATVLLALLPARALAEDARDGDLALREGRYQDAVRIFTDLTLEHPDDPDLYGWLGAARYRAGDYVGAARAYERQAQLTDDPDARFNAGNAYWRSGRLDRALERYDQTLAADPQHPGASQNRPMVEQEIQKRRELQIEHLGSEQQPSQKEPGDPQQGDQGQQGGSEQGPPQDGPPQQGQGAQGQGQQGQGAQPGTKPDGSQGDDGSAGSGGNQPPQGPKGSAQAPGQQGGQPPQDDGTRAQQGEDGEADGERTEGAGSPTGEPTDAQGAPGQGGGAQAGKPTGMTPEQAGRVLDGVEEGAPRVYIPGERSDKPW